MNDFMLWYHWVWRHVTKGVDFVQGSKKFWHMLHLAAILTNFVSTFSYVKKHVEVLQGIYICYYSTYQQANFNILSYLSSAKRAWWYFDTLYVNNVFYNWCFSNSQKQEIQSHAIMCYTCKWHQILFVDHKCDKMLKLARWYVE